jgi:polar amino acid transport system substrate-binding protein
MKVYFVRTASALVRLVRLTLLATILATLAAAPAAAAGQDQPGCQPDQAAAKYPSLAGKTIKIAADPAIQPYVFRDPANFDHLIGVDADLIPMAMACVGLKYDYSLGAWGGLLPSVVAGQADMMWANLYYTPERAQQVDFVVFERAGTGGLVKAGNPKNIQSMDDVCGNTAAAGVGTVEETTFKQQSDKCVAEGKQPIQLVDYPDVPAGSRLVANDRADIMLSDLGVTTSLVQAQPDNFTLGFTIFTDYKVGPAVQKGNADLLNAVYDGLKAQEANGVIKQVLQTYGIDPALAIPVERLTE